MKDKGINDYKDYLQQTKKRDIRLTSSSSEVNIYTSLWNDRTFIDVALVALGIYGTYNVDDKSFYLIPILIVWILLIAVIWSDFNRINKIRVDFLSNSIHITSRNFFKRIFVNERRYDFNDVDSFKSRPNFSTPADTQKYFIDAKLKTGVIVTLTFFNREEQAFRFISFLTDILKN